jgi:hypothetical protein
MKYLFLLACLLLLLFLGLPDIVLYSKTGLIRWAPVPVIFIGIPYLLYKTLAEFNVNLNLVMWIPISSVLMIGPLFGLWTAHLSKKDLEKNGKTVTGIISEKWYFKNEENYSGEWLYKARFRVDQNVYYTFSQKDVNNIVKIGDTVQVKYSRRNPENNVILK